MPPSAAATVSEAIQDSQDLSAIPRLYDVYRNPKSIQGALAHTCWSLVKHGHNFVWRVQSNRIAHGIYEQHTVQWDADGLVYDDTDAEKEEALSRLRDAASDRDDRRSDRADTAMRAEIDRLRAEL